MAEDHDTLLLLSMMQQRSCKLTPPELSAAHRNEYQMRLRMVKSDAIMWIKMNHNIRFTEPSNTRSRSEMAFSLHSNQILTIICFPITRPSIQIPPKNISTFWVKYLHETGFFIFYIGSKRTVGLKVKNNL